MLLTFLKGLLLGLSIAAPVGPIGILCIRRTLAMGQLVGLVSGLGAATADGLYGCIAGFGLTAVASFLAAQATWLRLIGGAFLCYLGLSTFLSKPAVEAPQNVASMSAPASVSADPVNESPHSLRSLLSAYSSTLALTLTNPATIFSFAAIFAGFGVVAPGQNYAASGVLVLGVFIGSALWWFFLSGLVGLFRTRFTPNRMRWLNRISGIILIGFGIIAIAVWV